MSNILNIIKEEDKNTILKNLSLILNEKEEVVTQILPIWNSIVLASLIKLTHNRIRFLGLQNFIQNQKIPVVDIESLKTSNSINFAQDKIVNYGESLMGILIPDKKSALAALISQNFPCRSSLVLKGLSIIYSLYGEFLLNDYPQILADRKVYVEYFSTLKNSIFDENVSEKIQNSIFEILILSEIFDESSNNLLDISDDSDESISDEVEDKPFYFQPILIGSFILLAIISLIIFWYINKSNEEVENVREDIEEIIPIDSLNKLNDSLTKAVVDSSRIMNDSLQILIWPQGKEFQVPKKSSIIKIHEYLSDSTQTEPLKVSCSEFSFDKETDQIMGAPDYFFIRLVEGLNKYKNIKLKLYTFSDKGISSSIKRGFLLKNRLVGEGLSPKRIEVITSKNTVKSDNTIPLNNQVVFDFQK